MYESMEMALGTKGDMRKYISSDTLVFQKKALFSYFSVPYLGYRIRPGVTAESVKDTLVLRQEEVAARDSFPK